jgi:hypothetical protein
MYSAAKLVPIPDHDEALLCLLVISYLMMAGAPTRSIT